MNFFKIKSFPTLVFFIFFPLIVLSQLSKKPREALVDSIFKYYEKDTVTTINFISEYIKKSKRENKPKSTFNGYHFFVCFYNEQQYNIRNQIKYTDSMLLVAKRNNLKLELLKAYHLQNDNYRMDIGYADKRIFENIFEALKIANEIESKVWECKFTQDIAEYYKYTRQFDKAIFHYRDNLKELKKLSKSSAYQKAKVWGVSLESSYLNIADVFIKLKKVDSAKLYVKNAESILDTIDSDLSKYYKLQLKVRELEINLLTGNIDSAKVHYANALNINPTYLKESDKEYWTSYYSGMISYEEKDFKNAIYNLESIDTTNTEFAISLGLFHNEIYKVLYKSYLKTRNLKKADYYFEKHLVSMKSQIDINNRVNSNFKEIEINNYNNEVRIVKTQNLRNRLIILFVSVLFLIILFFTVIIYKNRLNNDKVKLELLLKRISKKEERNKKSKAPFVKIKDVEVSRIIRGLDEMEDEKYFLKMDCTASNLAKKINTNTTYLSKIINSHYQKNFTEYINDLRIDFTLDRLNNNKLFSQYSILAIANEIGFKSKESFNSAFKKRTGVLPSNLIKALNKQKKK